MGAKLIEFVAKSIVFLSLALFALAIMFVVASNTVLHNIPVKPSATPTPTVTPTITNTPEPTSTPTVPPFPTVTLAAKKDGYTDDLCLNLQLDIISKANILDAKGNILSPSYDYDTNSCTYKFAEDGWFGEQFGYGIIMLSIQEQEPDIAVLTFNYKDTTERGEQIVDWSAAILSVINPDTNVLAASNTISESASNMIAMSGRYTVFTQLDTSDMTLKIMIADDDELVQQ